MIFRIQPTTPHITIQRAFDLRRRQKRYTFLEDFNEKETLGPFFFFFLLDNWHLEKEDSHNWKQLKNMLVYKKKIERGRKLTVNKRP